MADETKETWAGAGPVIITNAPEESARGAETIMRIAYGMISAMVVSLIWIIGSSADAKIKAWSVIIGLSVTATLLAGHAIVEVGRIRQQLAVSEARTQAAVAAVAQTVAAQSHLLARPPAAEPAAQRPVEPERAPRRRPNNRRRRKPADDPGQLISDEFRVYLQGRESRYNDGPGSVL
jgi:hypothetical protein